MKREENRNIELHTKDKFTEYLFQLDRKLIRKILRKMGIGCTICGWSEGTCDYHHINGRKIHFADTEYNIAIVCPNCHRLIHEKKIEKNTLVPLGELIGHRWKNYLMIHEHDGKVYYLLR